MTPEDQDRIAAEQDQYEPAAPEPTWTCEWCGVMGSKAVAGDS